MPSALVYFDVLSLPMTCRGMPTQIPYTSGVSLPSHATTLCHVVSETAAPSLVLYSRSVASEKLATLIPLCSLVRTIHTRPWSSILLMCSIRYSFFDCCWLFFPTSYARFVGWLQSKVKNAVLRASEHYLC